MRTRTPRTRDLLAAATLAALPLFTGILQGGPVRATADAVAARDAGDRRNGPQWSFIVGNDNGDRTGCWLLTGGWAQVWCRVYAL